MSIFAMKIKNQTISVSNLTETDINDIVNFICDNFIIQISFEEMQRQLSNININYTLSKVAKDENNNICGIIIISNLHLSNGSPLRYLNFQLHQQLYKFKCLNGFLFLIKSEFRGYGLDRCLLRALNINETDYDIIWSAVDKKLNSHNYWKRFGFTKLLEIDEAIFYIYKTSNNNIVDYLLEKIPQYENHN